MSLLLLWGCSLRVLLVLLCREADRVILTTCQEKGAHLDTFHAISQKLGNKTASEVRVLGRGAGKVRVLSHQPPKLQFDDKIISVANKSNQTKPCSVLVVPKILCALLLPGLPLVFELHLWHWSCFSGSASSFCTKDLLLNPPKVPDLTWRMKLFLQKTKKTPKPRALPFLLLYASSCKKCPCGVGLFWCSEHPELGNVKFQFHGSPRVTLDLLCPAGVPQVQGADEAVPHVL